MRTTTVQIRWVMASIVLSMVFASGCGLIDGIQGVLSDDEPQEIASECGDCSTADGWFDRQSRRCCSGTGVCQCRDQEYRSHDCEGDVCTYEITDVRYVTQDCTPCGSGEICEDSVCVAADECTADRDCNGDRCDDGVCVDCIDDADCVEGVCDESVTSTCVECLESEDCPDGLDCENSHCIGCETDEDCSGEETCYHNSCCSDQRTDAQICADGDVTCGVVDDDCGQSVWCGCADDEMCVQNQCQQAYLYVGRLDGTLFRLNPDGTEQWSTKDVFAVRAVATDPKGNAFAGYGDGYIRKYDEDGDQQWISDAHKDRLGGIAADGGGYAYGAGLDNSVRKIAPGGNQEWWANVHMSSVIDIDVDDAGNVYSVSHDQTVRKFDADGSEQWRFDQHGDAVISVAVSPDGMVYSGAVDGTIYSQSSPANVNWVVDDIENPVRGLSVDAENNVFVGLGSPDGQGAVMRLDNQGEKLWSKPQPTGVIEVAVTPDQRIYAGRFDGHLVALDYDGQQLWDIDLSGNAVDTDLVGVTAYPGAYGAFSDAWE